MSMWSVIGDATNTVLMWFTVFFLIAGAGHLKDTWDLASWSQGWSGDGFCLVEGPAATRTCSSAARRELRRR